MRIRRGLLFWGLFLILLGGIPLLARAGTIDPAAFADAWRLWPLVLVVIGLTLLLGRYRAGLIGVVAMALLLGSLAGGAMASGGLGIASFGDCSLSARDTNTFDQSGTLSTDSALVLNLPCGTADVTVQPGTAWNVNVDYRGDPPPVVATEDMLRLGAADGDGGDRQDWTITVGADALRSIDLQANAGSSVLQLTGASLTSVSADINAADLRNDAGAATIDRLDISANAGRARITLGGGATTGSLSANAGAIDLCISPDASVRIVMEDQLTFAHNLDERGFTRDGAQWTRSDNVRLGADFIDLIVDGNAASFTLDPEEGCS